MLLAALGDSEARSARDVIDRASQAWGSPKLVIDRATGMVGAWDGCRDLCAGDDKAWLAEGWLDVHAAALSPGVLQGAKGDFALLGLHAGGLLLASGRAGGYRPIYVTRSRSGTVIACTRLARLLALLPERPPLDLDYLSASVLGHGRRMADSTPYLGVRRLQHGEALLLGPGAARETWSTLAPLGDPELPNDGELAIRLRDAIRETTRRSTGNASRVAVQVSGGLDSSVVLSLLVSLAQTGDLSAPPEALALESAAPAWRDDGPHLRSLEDHLGVRAHRILPGDAAGLVGRLMVVDAMPAPSPILSAAGAIGAFARARGVDVVLTGVGGDQVLDGDPRLFAELARKGEIPRALDGALRTQGVFYEGHVGRLIRFFARPLLEPLLPQSLMRGLQRRRRTPPWAGPALVRYLAGSLAAPAGTRATLEESPYERYAKLLRWLAFSPLSSMRHQEEVVGGYTLRSPLLDDDFLRFAATIPPLSLMQGGFLRGLMREAMRDLVPEDLRLRKTKGTFYWFIERTIEEAGGLEILAAFRDVRMLADLQLVEPKPFRRFFDEFASAPRDGADYADLWSALSAEAFLREYAGETPARPE